MTEVEAAPPPATSLAVWDVPSAVGAGERFAVKVGVKSADGCALGGNAVAVRDGRGAVAATGTLGEAPWPGTEALYWTEIRLQAPATPGAAAFVARFDGGGANPPHGDGSAAFDVTVVEAAEHTLTVTVTDKDTTAPLADAHVRLGAFRAITGASGTAALRLAKGRYTLVVWKAGYEMPSAPLEITADTAFQVEMPPVVEENPDARWKM